MTIPPYFWRCTFYSLPTSSFLEEGASVWFRPCHRCQAGSALNNLLRTFWWFCTSITSFQASSCETFCRVGCCCPATPPWKLYLPGLCVLVLGQNFSLDRFCSHCPGPVPFSVHSFWLVSSSSLAPATTRAPVVPSPLSEPQLPKCHQFSIG